MFNIDVFFNTIGNLDNLGSLAVNFSTIVYLQFYAIETGTLSEELRLGLIVVIVDHTLIHKAAVAGVTSCFVIIITFVVGIILQNDPTTVFAGGVEPIVAATT